MSAGRLTRRKVATAFAAALFCATSVTSAFGASRNVVWSEPGAKLVDDRLLIMLAPAADRERVKNDLLQCTHATTIEDIHFNKDDSSIFVLSPQKGKREQTIKKISQVASQHQEITEVTRNYRMTACTHPKSERRPKPPSPGTGPDDRHWHDQWNLGNMNWGQAWSNYASQQTNQATVVILGSGCVPTQNDELGPHITEYDAFQKDLPIIPVQGGGDVEGDIDCSVPGAKTNNRKFIAGAASFQESLPCHVILMKVVRHGAPDKVAVTRAVAFLVNNQSTLTGGHGFPASLSYNTQHFYTDPYWQNIGQKLLNANALLVMAAGDVKNAYRNEPTGKIAVVQATDYDNNLFLVRVQGDALAAPGAIQPAIIDGKYNHLHDGSSFSAPLWSSCIAMLIAFNPNLSAAQANQILVNTGTQNTSQGNKDGTNPWPYVIPNLNAAINTALNGPIPSGSMPPTVPGS